MTIQELKVGDSASMAKTISESDVYLFAGITGDHNPAHVNEEASKQTAFGGRIVHGILSAGLISAVLAMKLPGPGTIYLGQELKFTKPVRFGDTVTATCTVSEILAEKNIIKLDTICTNQAGEVVIKGVATVMPPKA
ncbi:MAG TPA: MaoC family dehydratase [Candidatus Intestinimonas stercoravium]|uniref:MaoC family dehydratase n=1 Tax=uncultured Intestinimonas sp. TaxID=1689265 RepID=UPI001F9A121B|nr:MaoC family dehydratase [uncultured Intestinimonas sp.]HJA63201.1 MaoC family dehydratase [Candidatus Intestinimonas stercoravium]